MSLDLSALRLALADEMRPYLPGVAIYSHHPGSITSYPAVVVRPANGPDGAFVHFQRTFGSAGVANGHGGAAVQVTFALDVYVPVSGDAVNAQMIMDGLLGTGDGSVFDALMRPAATDGTPGTLDGVVESVSTFAVAAPTLTNDDQTLAASFVVTIMTRR